MVIFAGLRHVLVVCAEVSDIWWLSVWGSQTSGLSVQRSKTSGGHQFKTLSVYILFVCMR